MQYSKEAKRSLRLLIALTLVALAVPLIMSRGSNAASKSVSQSPVSPQSQSQDKRPDKKFHRAGKPIRDRYIVVLNSDTPADDVETITNDLLSRHGGTTGHVYKHALKGFSIQLTEAAAMALSQDPRVQYVQEDGEATFNTTQTVPNNWGLDRIDQRNLPVDNSYHYANVNTGAGVHVYVVDSGIQNTHTEFRNSNGTTRVVRDYDGVWDFQNGNDCNGHGTAVAGVIGSNTFGVAKGATLHAIRVAGCDLSTSNSTIIGGINWAVEHRQLPAVMNLSLDSRGIDYAMEDAVRTAIDRGITCVVAAGKDNDDAGKISPQRVAEAITVGATNNTDTRAWFSNFGPFIDVFAPGVNITSTSNADLNRNGTLDDAAEGLFGTSLAAAFVSGIAARFIEAHPGVQPSSVQGAIINSATPDVIPDPGPGSPNLLTYSEIHAQRGVGGGLVGSILESAPLIASGLYVGDKEWPAFTGLGEIWAGVLFTLNNGPQGWNSIENGSEFPLPGSRPFSLLGIVDGQTFYIGRSNALRTNFSSSTELLFRTNDNVPGNGSGEFKCVVELWKNLPDSSADFVSQTVPTTVFSGQSFPVSITMKNVGTTTWTAGEQYKLALQPDSLTWSVIRVTVPNDVVPGATVTFNFNAVAPTTPGIYGLQWRMIDERSERFGDVTPNVTITVLAPNQAIYVSQIVPRTMLAGETYDVLITMKNVGNTTWQTSNNYRLGSQSPQDNLRWGTNRVPLPFAVPPGGQVTIPFSVTAPFNPGTYNFQWRMVQDGVEWFGSLTPNVQVSVKSESCLRC